MKIAVIGAGLFGCTAAFLAARRGHEVHLFDGADQVMSAASRSTFARLHRGYHYPRSPETGRESRMAEASFRAEYGEAVIDRGRQTYIVADGGKVLASDYRRFLDYERLPYDMEGDATFTVVEPRIDLARLGQLVRGKLALAGVLMRLGKRWDIRSSALLQRSFDVIVIACYARSNCLTGALGIDNQILCKFQVVEKPVVTLPKRFAGNSIVVVDGDFGCVDPHDDSDRHVLGHVSKTIHAENVGLRAKVPPHLVGRLDQFGVSEHSRWREVADDLARYIPGVEKAIYHGSYFTVRAVLAHCEDSDWRPTLVERVSDRTVRIFSGKLGTAVDAAERALAACEERHLAAA